MYKDGWMGEKEVNSIFRLPRLPKEVMLQLSDELSQVELPCLVGEHLIDQFWEDLRSQRYDDNSSNGSTVNTPANSKQSSTVIQPDSSRQSDIHETSAEDQEEESEDDNEMYQSFNRTINQSDNSETSSPEHSFNLDGIAQDLITNI